MQKYIMLLMTLVVGLLTACTGNSVATPTSAPPTNIPPTVSAQSGDTLPAAYTGPAWTMLPLTNARTGDTFTLADFAGQTVYVEPMALW